MGWRPQLNVVCGRCGKPSAVIGHVCVSNSTRKQTLKPKLSFGKCPKCRKPYGANPVLHVCAPRSDFGKRRKQFEQEQRAAARKARPAHDYTECSDAECKRSACVAFKTGQQAGDEAGYARGWTQGYDRGVADCPREHKLGDSRDPRSDDHRPARRVCTIRSGEAGPCVRLVCKPPRPVPALQGNGAAVLARCAARLPGCRRGVEVHPRASCGPHGRRVMSSGHFSGTWTTDRSAPVLPVIGVLILGALISWLATLLWLIALILGAFLVLALGGLVVIRRYNRRDYGRFLERQAAMPAAEPRRAVTAAAPPLTVIYGGTHLHFGEAPAAPRIIQAIPVDAITTYEGK